MKVNDILKLVNGATQQQPIYLQPLDYGLPARKAEPTDLNGYYYPEKYLTVKGVEVLKDRVVIRYQ